MPSFVVRDLPDEDHRRLRVAAAFRGESLSAFARRVIMVEVERVEAEMQRQMKAADRPKRRKPER